MVKDTVPESKQEGCFIQSNLISFLPLECQHRRPQVPRHDQQSCSLSQWTPKAPTGANVEVEQCNGYLCTTRQDCMKSTLSQTCYNLPFWVKDLDSVFLSVCVIAKAKKNWLIIPDKDVSKQLQSNERWFQNTVVPRCKPERAIKECPAC